MLASADGDAWQSFWACNNGKEGQRAGLNGVATFVRNKAFLSCGLPRTSR